MGLGAAPLPNLNHILTSYKHVEGETEKIRHWGTVGTIRAMAECFCRHDMMMMMINNFVKSCKMSKTW